MSDSIIITLGSSDTIHLGVELHNKIAGRLYLWWAAGISQVDIREAGEGGLHICAVAASAGNIKTIPTEGECLLISLGTLPSPIFVLRIIAVDKSARNIVCAAQLLAEFEERAKARGARSIVLSVLKSNSSARRLFVGHGMFPVSENQTSPMSDGKSHAAYTEYNHMKLTYLQMLREIVPVDTSTG